MSCPKLIEALHIEGLDQYRGVRQAPSQRGPDMRSGSVVSKANISSHFGVQSDRASETPFVSEAPETSPLIGVTPWNEVSSLDTATQETDSIQRQSARPGVARVQSAGCHELSQLFSSAGQGVCIGSTGDEFRGPMLGRKTARLCTNTQELSAHPEAEACQGGPENARPCAVCREDKPSVTIMELACGHCYCHTCLEQHVQSALASSSRLPPRCCREPVPDIAIRLLVPAAVVETYLGRLEEQREANRYFCHDISCGASIPLCQISGQVSRCGRCSELTCVQCRGSARAPHDYPEDTTLSEVLAAAIEHPWQRCVCGHIVEKSEGCNHIT